MKTEFTLKTERLVLKPISLEHAKGYSEIGVSYRSTGPINTEDKALAYIEKSLEAKDAFDVVILLEDEVIGTIELCHMDWFTRGGEICYTIKESHWGEGYATEAVKEFLKYCFKEMKLHKVYADTEPKNIGSQRVLEKLGFKLEGTIRDRQFKDGEWVDELQYGLLETERS